MIDRTLDDKIAGETSWVGEDVGSAAAPQLTCESRRPYSRDHQTEAHNERTIMAKPKRMLRMTDENRGVVAELVKVTDEIREAEEALRLLRPLQAQLKDELHLSLGGRMGTIQAGSHTVTVSAHRVVDWEKFKEDFPPGEHPYLYSDPKPSLGRLDDNLPHSIVADYVTGTELFSTVRRKPSA